MYPGGYTAEITGLSPRSTEKDVYDFFAHCGAIEYIEIIRSGEYARTAHVTFKDAYALETALLLSGATIGDRHVGISRWGAFIDDSDPWNGSSKKSDDVTSVVVLNSSSRSDISEKIYFHGQATHAMPMVSSPSEAVTLAQEVVMTMMAKGYDLGKDALTKAKAFDDSHQVSSTAAAKVAELSDRMGLTDKITAGREVVRSVDEKYHISDITRSAVLATGTAAVVAATVTGEAAVSAAHAVVNSSYFSRGALWVSDVLNRVAKAASDLANHGGK
ncbi:binding partner of ACD11 1-like isoform X1 [Rhodamnia argentea]|uniref:Binding partner of ACD11 1-like isoform X1 n=1 Tax=Rhodamnia argentea TaxID=178133 RepID=A0ABM3HTE0_9MYRT|nr:binding partner of ACD11 1-like isoform X1 [Rhodamnia argentea]XP_048139861.1 binding partner of ACD11 1-like isoform X1 [Rhodamnia argentea]XP_048139862.1 binding partner of ACD11 1-like isoform X1 [Rhodamnia argentea]